MGKQISDLTVRIGADTLGFTSGMKKAKGETDMFEKGISSLKGAVVGAFAVGSVIAFGSASAQAYNKQAQAENLLLTAVKGRTDVQQRLMAQASQLSKNSLFPDDELVNQQKYLASLGMQESQIKRVLAASVELSAATGMGLEEAVKNLAKTYGGLTGELGESIPGLKALTVEQLKNGEAVAYIEKNYKGFAETAANAGTGSFTQLANDFTNMQEAVGGLVVDGMKPFVGFLREAVQGVTDYVKVSYAEELEEEGKKVNTLAAELADANTPTEKRRDILLQLQKISPDIVKGLDAENLNYVKLRTNIEQYNDQLANRIVLATLEEDEQSAASSLAAQKLRTGQMQLRLNQLMLGVSKEITLSEGTQEEKVKRIVALLRAQVAEQDKADKGGQFVANPYGGQDLRSNEKKQLEAILEVYANLNQQKEKLNKRQAAAVDIQERVAALKELLGLNKAIAATDNPTGNDGNTDKNLKAAGSLAALKEQLAKLREQIENFPKAEQNLKPFGDLKEWEADLNKRIQLLEDYRNRVDQNAVVPIKSKQALVTIAPSLKLEGVETYSSTLKDTVDITEGATSVMKSSFGDLAMGIGESFGAMATGAGGMETLVYSVLGAFAGFIKKFGEMMITTAIAGLALSKAMKNLFNPASWGVALGAGILLVATGSAMQSSMTKATSPTPKLAQGGLAFGPTLALVGDNANARTDPEVIAPLSKLKTLNGGGDINLVGKFRIEGQDLVYVLQKANQQRKLQQ